MFKYRKNFSPAVGSTSVISVRYQLPLTLACKRFRKYGFLHGKRLRNMRVMGIRSVSVEFNF